MGVPRCQDEGGGFNLVFRSVATTGRGEGRRSPSLGWEILATVAPGDEIDAGA
jgi:hypothetical protein